MADLSRICPHCQSDLKKWRVPEGTSWDEEFFYVCFNDACSYYLKGWEWMQLQYGQRASYRYMISPASGVASPLPVWSETATREMIVEDEGGTA